MPTTIGIANVQADSAFSRQLPPVTIFLIIGLVELVVAVVSGGRWASFGEQSLWW